MLEFIIKNIARNKLTINATRITLKVRPELTLEQIIALQQCAERVAPLVRAAYMCTMRGRFRRNDVNGKLRIELADSTGKYTVAYDVDELPPAFNTPHTDI